MTINKPYLLTIHLIFQEFGSLHLTPQPIFRLRFAHAQLPEVCSSNFLRMRNRKEEEGRDGLTAE